MIHGDSPGADISERVVTLAKITGWRIGTAISTIAMSSVEHGMVQADVNTLVQAQLPIVTSQATMEANAILQTMSSSTTSEKPQSETENNDNISGGKKATRSGNSGGSGGTGVDSMGNNVNAQATSAPEATILAMQQAQQATVARWMNDLGGAPFMQQQQQQLQQLQQQQQQQQQLLLLQQQQQQQGGKSAQAAQYASLLMNLTGGEAVDAKATPKRKTNEVKKSTNNSS